LNQKEISNPEWNFEPGMKFRIQDEN
jgi:hypothetical protein